MKLINERQMNSEQQEFENTANKEGERESTQGKQN